MFSSIPSQVGPPVPSQLCGLFRVPCISLDPAVWHRYVPPCVAPRWAGAVLILGAVLIPVGAVVPPAMQPKIMLPVDWRWHGWDTPFFRTASVSPGTRT